MTTMLILTDTQATALQQYVSQLNELLSNANIVTLNGAVDASAAAKASDAATVVAKTSTRRRKATRGRVKLTVEDVKQIKEGIALKRPLSDLAKEFGCSYATVFAIKQKKAWKEVTI